MGVKILEKEGYKYSLWGSLLTLIIADVTLILTLVLYILDEISLGPTQIFQITALILGGLVFPGVIFTLNFLADQQIHTFKLQPLIFGIVTAALGVVIIVVAAISADYMLNYMDPSNPSFAASVGIITCFYLGILTMVICTYGGIQNAFSYLKNK